MKRNKIKFKWIFKVVILTFCLFIMIPDGHTQTTQKEREVLIESRNDLFQKGKRQTTIAWVMVSGGGVLTMFSLAKAVAAGTLAVATGGLLQSDKGYGGGGILIGLGAMVGSIPLFVAGSKNKNKALMMDIGIIPPPLWHESGIPGWSKRSSMESSIIPGVTISYRF